MGRYATTILPVSITVKSPDTLDSAVVVVLKCVSIVVLIIAGLWANIGLIYTVLKATRLRRPPYYCVINLSVTLLARAAVVLPVILASVLNDSKWPWGKELCTAAAFLDTLLTFGTHNSLVLQALERYLAVVHPRAHASRMEGKGMLNFLAITWGSPLLLALPPAFGLGTYSFMPWEARCCLEHRHHTNNDTLAYLLIALSLTAIVIAIYIRIFRFLRAHRKMRPILQPASYSQTWTFTGVRMIPNPLGGFVRVITQPTALGLPGQPHISGRYASTDPRTNESLTRLFVLVTVAFDITNLPLFVVYAWYVLDITRSVPYPFVTSSAWMTYIQVALVPLIMLSCHTPLRRALVNRRHPCTTSNTKTTDRRSQISDCMASHAH